MAITYEIRAFLSNNNSFSKEIYTKVKQRYLIYCVNFKGEKNQMTRDLAAQTQKLVDAKLTIQRLSDQNRDLQSDLNLSINLLRNKPNSFVSPKIDTLPPEVRSRVKTYIEGGSSGNGLQTRSKPDSLISRNTPRQGLFYYTDSRFLKEIIGLKI